MLKPGATYPGRLEVEEDWLAAPRLKDGQLSRDEAEREDYVVWSLPQGTVTRALRFTHTSRALDKSYAGWLGGVFVLSGRMVIVRGAEGAAVEDANTRLWSLAGALKGRCFQSMIVDFTQTDLDTFGPWNRHETEDMLFVIVGRLAFHSEGYETAILNPGDSVHFDGAMPHACLTDGPGSCRCLYVFTAR